MLTLDRVLCNHWNELTFNMMFLLDRLCSFNPVSCIIVLFLCLLVGLMEHTKRLLRAFFELSQTHRGEWLIKVRNYYVLLICLVHSLTFDILQSKKIKVEHNIVFIDLSLSQLQFLIHLTGVWNSALPAFGDVFSVIGVREPQAAASEAFVKFADAHRNIEKYGIQLLKTIKPVSKDS